jgi:hypothetical protein
MQLVPTRPEGPVPLAPNAHGDGLCSVRDPSAPRLAEIAEWLPF